MKTYAADELGPFHWRQPHPGSHRPPLGASAGGRANIMPVGGFDAPPRVLQSRPLRPTWLICTGGTHRLLHCARYAAAAAGYRYTCVRPPAQQQGGLFDSIDQIEEQGAWR
jgi:hypothetical protein